MRKRNLVALLLVGAVAQFVACDAESPMASEETSADVGSRADVVAASSAYEITIENLTGGQPFTPPLVATHHPNANVFDVGAPASVGVQQIAENGNLGPLNAALRSDPYVSDVVIAASSVGPTLPGMSVTFRIEADPGATRFSFVAMLICTNDGFVGVDSGRLPRRVGQTVSGERMAYDAGTEINTEDFGDMVPPCPALTGFRTEKPGTGMSDPALAEGGVIAKHPGIAGGADLDPGVHGWSGPVAQITVTRIR